MTRPGAGLHHGQLLRRSAAPPCVFGSSVEQVSSTSFSFSQSSVGAPDGGPFCIPLETHLCHALAHRCPTDLFSRAPSIGCSNGSGPRLGVGVGGMISFKPPVDGLPPRALPNPAP